jgi:uncharacterized membrane protein
MDSSDQLVVCVFDGKARTDEVYQALRSLDRRLDEIKLGNVAVVRKSVDGQVAIGETYDLKFNASLIGRLPLAGMLVGLIAGRTGILGLSRIGALALGGAAGLLAGVAISSLDLGFSDEALQQLGVGLGVEQWAIVMLVRPSEEGYVRVKLTSLGGTLIQSSLPPETIAQLTAPGRARPSKRQLAAASSADV